MNRIRELRKQKELTQVEMAKLMQVSQGTLSYWERGDFEPDYETLNKLADFFGVTTDYLLNRTDEPNPSGVPLKGVYLRLARDAQDKSLPDEAIKRIYEIFDEFAALNGNDQG